MSEIEGFQDIRVKMESGDASFEIGYDSVTQDFTQDSRYLILNSAIKYKTKEFEYNAVLPTVKIPYADPVLGFLINGVFSSTTGIYQRVPGTILDVDTKNSKSGVIESARVDIISAYNTRMSVRYYQNAIVLTVRRNNIDTHIPIGVFLKALSGLPYEAILEQMAVVPQELQNSFVQVIPDRRVDFSTTAVYMQEGDPEPNITDCVAKVYSAINAYSKRRLSNTYSAQWQAERIGVFLNSLQFKNKEQMETSLSVASRAIKTQLQHDLVLRIFNPDGEVGEFRIPAGEFIDEAMANEIRKHDITRIPAFKTQADGEQRKVLLQEASAMVFRAKGYKLAEDTCGMSAGTIIGDEELKVLNASEVLRLEVVTPDGRKVLYRSDSKVCLGDFINIINMLVTALPEDVDSSAVYNVANRIIIGYDRQVRLEVEQAYNDIGMAIMGADTMAKVVESMPRLPFNRLTQVLKDPSRREHVQSELTNVMATAIARSKASALLSEAPKDMTAVQTGQYGRLDSLHAPESKKIGAVQQLTVMANINPVSGEIETPYEVVENGVPTGRIQMVSALQELGKYIVEWNNDLSSAIVLARKDGDITTVRREQVSYRDPNPFVDMSVSRATIPFPEFSQPKRALMAAKMGGQAVPLIKPERAIVGTGGDTEIPCMYYTARQVIESAGVTPVEGESLKIVSSEWGRMLTYSMVHAGIMFKYTVPFTPTSKDTLFNYNLNVKPNNEYQLDDIVLYNQSCDITEKDFWVREAQGAYPYVKDYHKPGLALGVNLRVGFKTYMSSTVDDAVMISSELVTNQTLSNIQIMRYEYKCRANDTIMQHDMPHVHEYVRTGDPVIAFQRSREGSAKVKTVNAKQPGEVILIEHIKKENKIMVWVASYHNATEGDKVAGRYGNKSVIAKIVPKEFMPYDPETGESLQIVCNPLGIPSRMNLGQVIEVTLGAAMACEGKTAMVTPFYEGIKQEVIDEYQRCGLKPKQLFLPEYGKFTERPVMVGILYFMKLEQMSNLKWSAVGMPKSVDAVFGQPVASLNTKKGQPIADWESWVLIAAGAKKQLNTYYTISSTDASSRKRYFEMLAANSDDDSHWSDGIGDVATHDTYNINALVTQALFRTAGLDLEVGDDNNYHVTPLDMNNIPTVITLDKLRGHLEYVSPNTWTKIALHKPCINPFWIYNFPLSVLLGTSVKTILNKTAYVSTVNKAVVRSNEIADFSKKFYLTGIDAIIYLLQNSTIDEWIGRLRKEAVSGSSSGQDSVVFKIDADLSLDENRDLYGVLPEYSELISFLYRMKDSGKQPSDLVMNYMPVLPGIFRQSDKMSGGQVENELQNFTIRIAEAVTSEEIFNALKLYIGFGGESLKERNNIRRYFFGRGGASGEHGRVRKRVLSKQVGFSGRTVIVPMADPSISPFFVGLPWREVLTEMSAMLAIRIRKHLPKMISDCGMPNGMIKIPYFELAKVEELVLSLSEFDYVKINRIIGFGSMRWCYNLFTKLRAKVKEYVEGEVRDDGAVKYQGTWIYPEDLPEDATLDAMVVSFGRQPTLHLKSLRTYFVKLVEGYCARIHPCNCKGYNADFDGDQMWNAQLLGESKIESFKTTSILQGLISEKDGSYTLDLAQDIALGLYCITTLKDNVARLNDQGRGVFHYQSIEKLEFDTVYGDLHFWDLVLFEKSPSQMYFSTVGRILANSKLPHGLTDMAYHDRNGLFYQVFGENAKAPTELRSLAYDCIWTATGMKSAGHENTVQLSSIQLDVYNGFGARESVMVTQRLYELGLTGSDIYSVSMDINDLGVDFDVKSMLDEPRKLVSELNSLCQLGLISEQERKSSTIRIWSDVKKDAQAEIIKRIPQNSNMYYILYSGARGNADQMMQVMGFIGNIFKTEKSDIEYPILSGYGNGLSAFDLMQTCYSARNGVVSTQTGTEETGYATRQSVYMMSGLEIKEDDCGIDSGTIEVQYSEGGISESQRKDLLGGFIVDVPDGYDILRPVLTRTGYMITDEVLDLISNSGIKSIETLDGVVNFDHAMAQTDRNNLKDMYSYALPYCENMRITDKTVDWIEYHGLTEVVAFDQSVYESGDWFEGKAYLPVEYDAQNQVFYVIEDNEEVELDEEMLFTFKVLDKSEKFKYYKNLLSEDSKLTIKALRYLSSKFVRMLCVEDANGIERVVNIRYHLTQLFSKLVISRIAYGLPYLDADQTITQETLAEIERVQLEYIAVRTSLTCFSNGGICSKCYGKNMYSGHMTPVGTNLGITAAQTMCQPLSQATLNVQHAGGKRSGLTSGLRYYRKLLTGSLVTDRVAHLAERYSPISGFARRSPVNPALLQIIGEDGAQETVLTDDPERIEVPDGAYVEAGQTIISGLPILDRYCSRNVPKSAIQTRYLLLQEYDKVMASLGVLPRNYEILARAQTSNCRLIESSSLPFTRDTGEECKDPTGYYILQLSSQMETVMRYSGIACVSFERAYSMMTMLALSRTGVPLGSALGNILTGTPIESKTAMCIPKCPAETSMNTQSVNSQIESYLHDYHHKTKDGSDFSGIKTAPSLLGTAESADKLFELLGSEEGTRQLESGALLNGAEDALGLQSVARVAGVSADMLQLGGPQFEQSLTQADGEVEEFGEPYEEPSVVVVDAETEGVEADWSEDEEDYVAEETVSLPEDDLIVMLKDNEVDSDSVGANQMNLFD